MGNESFPTHWILDVLTDGQLGKKVGYIMKQLGEHMEYFWDFKDFFIIFLLDELWQIWEMSTFVLFEEVGLNLPL